MPRNVPPIVKEAETLLLKVEQAALLRRFDWLPLATTNRRFHHRLEGRPLNIRRPRHRQESS